MASPIENKLRMEALSKGLSGPHADSYVSGALNRIHQSKGGTAIHPKKPMGRSHPGETTSKKITLPKVPGLSAGKKVNLAALMQGQPSALVPQPGV